MMILKAFIVGGLICIAGQLLIDLTSMTPARILVLFVTLGVAFYAVGLYQPLVDFAGAGATVPLLGFGYALEGCRGGGAAKRPDRFDNRRSNRGGGRHILLNRHGFSLRPCSQITR